MAIFNLLIARIFHTSRSVYVKKKTVFYNIINGQSVKKTVFYNIINGQSVVVE